MAQRYSLQVPERRGNAPYEQNFTTPQSLYTDSGAAMSGLGRGLGYISATLQQRDDEQARFDAMLMQGEYVRAMNQYFNDPDTGAFNTRQLGDARGLTSESLEYSEKLRSDLTDQMRKRGMSKQAQDQFFVLSERSRQPFETSASRFESAQMSEYNKLEFQSFISSMGDLVASNPYSQEAFTLALEQTELMVAENMRGAPPETIEQAHRNIASKMELARIASVAQDNIFEARDMAEQSAFLSADDKKAAQKLYQGEIEKIQIQQSAQAIVNQYGPDGKAAALLWIRKNTFGSQQDSLATAVKTLYTEIGFAEAAHEQSLQEFRKGIQQEVFGMYQIKGLLVPQEYIQSLMDAGEFELAQKYVSYNETFADRSNRVARVIAADPNMSRQDAEATVRAQDGISEQQVGAMFSYINRAILTGEMTQSRLQDLRADGFLTGEEYERYNDLLGRVPSERKTFIASAAKDLDKQLTDLVEQYGLAPEAAETARNRFMELISGLTLDEQANFADSTSSAFETVLTEALTSQPRPDRNRRLREAVNQYTELARGAIGRSAYNMTEQQVKSMQPEPARDLPSNVNRILYDHAGAYSGEAYKMGGKAWGRGGIDCAFLVEDAMPKMMDAINKRSGYEVFPKAAKEVFSRGRSADMLKRLQDNGVEVFPVRDYTQLREGMVIGLDAKPGQGGGRFNDIDHISMVVRNNDGQLYIYEANRANGVGMQEPAASYIARYRNRGVPIFAGNPLEMADRRIWALAPQVPAARDSAATMQADVIATLQDAMKLPDAPTNELLASPVEALSNEGLTLEDMVNDRAVYQTPANDGGERDASMVK